MIRMTTLSTVGVAGPAYVSHLLPRQLPPSTAARTPILAARFCITRHPSVTNEHYNRATSLSAAENFRQIVRQYEK